jgi:hypothetical protein
MFPETSGISFIYPVSTAIILFTCVKVLPDRVSDKSVKVVLILVKLPLKFVRLFEKMLSPVKKEVAEVVTFPFNKSSVKMAREQAMFLKVGPTFEEFTSPILVKGYHS